MSAQVAVIVLAGGEGRRIGGGKPLRLLAGERLIDRALAKARNLSATVALSVGSTGQLPDFGVAQIIDPHPKWGALGGLAAGLGFAAEQGLELALTLPCDSPFLPGDLLDRLKAALRPGQGVAVPRTADQLHVACGLWRSSLAGMAMEYGARGERSLHGLAELAGFVAVDWPAEPFDPFFNINSPEELALAEEMVGMRK